MADFSPRIYCIDPTLVARAGWNDLLERCAAMGFDHVLLCGDNLVADLLAESESGSGVAPADSGLSSLAQLEQLAHLCTEHRLRVLLDLSLTRVHADDAAVLRHPEWFALTGSSSAASTPGRDVLPDPRHPGAGLPVNTPRLDVPEVAEAMLAWWHARLAVLIDAGVAGFCCREPASFPAQFWCRLIDLTREQRSCCHFLAWTPGCTHRQLDDMAGCGFDGVFSSGAWWDFRAPWYFREYDKLAAIAPVLAFPEDPFGPRLARIHGFRDKQARRLGALRALHFATVSGAGWLMTMGFEFGLTDTLSVARHAGAANRLSTPQDYAQACADAEFDLSKDVLEANRAMAKRRIESGSPLLRSSLRPLSAPDASLLFIERRDADASQLIAVNPQLDHAVRISDLGDTGWQQRLAGSAVQWHGEDRQVPPGAVRLLDLEAPPAVGSDPGRRKKPVPDKVRSARIVIEHIAPAVDDGKFAAKRTVGERFIVSADIFMDGHEHLAASVLVRAADEKQWRRITMHHHGNDRWQATLSLTRLGRHYFCIEAWSDVFETYRDGLKKKHAAGVNVQLELEEGRILVAALVEQGLENGVDGTVLERSAALLKALTPASAKKRGAGKDHVKDSKPEVTEAERLALLCADDTAQLIEQLTALAGARAFLARSAAEYPLEAERAAATYASWYELFPRSQSGRADVHGNFDDVIARLPAIRAMGFDTLYFPPIHPIGEKNRKGKNNALDAGPEDPGSPYAIGSAEGGHDAIHPQLGTLEDFLRLRDAAEEHGLELALDFAIQCAPDHPWLREHPGWFAWRPDGSMRYAENPPKKYQDIVNVDFYADEAIPDLWVALRDVVIYWVQQGVNVFRVDNPHTKPFPFWEWMIGAVRSRYPQVIFLSEAFTRPKPMYRLAKVGFSQSYTYFTWRHTKQEFIDYLTELTADSDGIDQPRDFFRPHFFVNTPDINPEFLQRSGRAGFQMRAALAATLSGLWGVYSGFELCEAQAIPGKEEYLNSEKYEIRAWDWQQPGNIIEDITLLNHIRAENPALQSHLGVRFLTVTNDNILYFVKSTRASPPSVKSSMKSSTSGAAARFGDNVVLVAISLDPFQPQQGDIELPLEGFGLADDGRVHVEDLVTERRFTWSGRRQSVRLDPHTRPYAIWRIRAGEA
ncbi:alpha-1,4-glucan--maltose-1-phosphate maltosyltransferase [Herbaspirillum rhizosphaerae]|uniref:alpha-1,4-glucan--maltose-1-phosphate maltosyltransferase n=1 Tax=Herbaspirillum rhizosphaerae TaxID=346179 RepID=UPI000A498AD0|nr:alpha-1,4-glucan--maltose-1-phosphate maltosyltransferase [Herbaspirillum rhizosphaerae]